MPSARKPYRLVPVFRFEPSLKIPPFEADNFEVVVFASNLGVQHAIAHRPREWYEVHGAIYNL